MQLDISDYAQFDNQVLRLKNKNILTGKKYLCYSKTYDYHNQIKSEGILFSTIIKNKLKCQGLCLEGYNGHQR